MRTSPWRSYLEGLDPILRIGRVRKITPTHLEADGPDVSLGTLCEVEARRAHACGPLLAEVVRVSRDSIALSPFEDTAVTFSGARVKANPWGHTVTVGPSFLGRAIDGLGRPTDGKGPIRGDHRRLLYQPPPTALERASPESVLETGIRAIDGLVTLGKGQRVGLFAASGVGKTTLLAQFARQVTADVVILCLVGERGREVEFTWNQILDETARSRATLVSATSDQSAAMRVRACHYALALAEFWRDRGCHVLLAMDSITRVAMAMREIGLAAGEPPTVRAYTPNVFAQLPKIVERCGALRAGGAISAVMAVLSESDEIADPVSELMKSLLDGHIVLSRTLAEQAQFPAVDLCRSISRQSEIVMNNDQRREADRVLEWLSLQQSSRTLVETGLYSKGANPKLDRALERHGAITQFMMQGRNERVPLKATLAELAQLAAGGH